MSKAFDMSDDPDTSREDKVVIENWRQEYNMIRPPSSLNGLPPAQEAVLPFDFQPPQLIRDSSELGSTLIQKLVQKLGAGQMGKA